MSPPVNLGSGRWLNLKVDEVRALNDEELKKQLETARKELLDLRFRLATKQLVNDRELRRVKKEIARLLTIKNERELGIGRPEKA